MRKSIFTIVLVFMLIGSSIFYYNTEWKIPETMNDEKVVYVNEDEKFMITNHSGKDYLSLHILENNTLGLAGKSLRNYDSFMVDIENIHGENLFRKEEVMKEGNISFATPIDLEDGEYRVIIYYGNIVSGKSKEILTNYKSNMKARLLVKDGIYSIPRSETYRSNLEHMRRDNDVKKKHLNLMKYSKEEREKFQRLVQEILGDEEDVYKKAFLISNWVSNNIYYNVDGLKEENYGVTDAFGTLNLGYSVCQGYAELTDALLKTVGIPSRLTSGYGLDGSGKKNEKWKDIEPDETNHIWNEAYINGRWIIIDTTWNSNNKREEGKLSKEPADMIYFDVSLEYFSEKHRIDVRQ